MTSQRLSSDTGSDTFDHGKAQRGARLLIEAIGADPDAAPLAETWQRRVPDALETLSEGHRDAAKPTMRTFPAEGADDLVVKTGIPVHSLCEHHLLPYTGRVCIGYRPGDEVVGLSKLTRYVRWQSRRLTTQEHLTSDIAAGLAAELDAEAVVIAMSATHLCEAMRGIETTTETQTTATAGDPTTTERQRVLDAMQATDTS